MTTNRAALTAEHQPLRGVYAALAAEGEPVSPTDAHAWNQVE